MKTKFAKKEDFYNGICQRDWWIVDAEGKTLGRMASRIAHLEWFSGFISLNFLDKPQNALFHFEQFYLNFKN